MIILFEMKYHVFRNHLLIVSNFIPTVNNVIIIRFPLSKNNRIDQNFVYCKYIRIYIMIVTTNTKRMRYLAESFKHYLHRILSAYNEKFETWWFF